MGCIHKRMREGRRGRRELRIQRGTKCSARPTRRRTKVTVERTAELVSRKERSNVKRKRLKPERKAERTDEIDLERKAEDNRVGPIAQVSADRRKVKTSGSPALVDWYSDRRARTTDFLLAIRLLFLALAPILCSYSSTVWYQVT